MALATLSIDLEARLAKFTQGLDAAVKVSEQQAARITGAFNTAGAAIASLGIGAIVVQQLDSLRSAVSLADKIDDLGEKYGIAAGKLSEYRYAAEVAGTPTDALASGIQKLSKAAAEGNKGLALMGVSVRSQTGGLKDTDQLLLEVADKFSRYEDGAAKSALAMEVFGKSGADMLPLLNKGAAGIQTLREEGKALGAVFGDDLAKASGDFNDNLKRLELAAEGAKVSIAGSLLPILDTLLLKTIAGVRAFGSLTAAFDAIVLKTDPTKGPGGVLKDVAAEFESNEKRLSDIAKKIDAANKNQYAGFQPTLKAEAKDLEARNAQLKPYLAYLKESQRIEALQGSGGVLDSKDARAAMTAGAGRLKPPIISDGKAAEDSLKQYNALIEKIKQKREETDAELASGAKLTEADKFRIEILGKLNSAESKLSQAQKDDIKTKLDGAVASLKKKQADEERQKVVQHSIALTDKAVEASVREAASYADGNTRLLEQIEGYGLLSNALDELSLARLDQELLNKRADLVVAQNIEGAAAEAQALARVVEQLQRRRDLTAQLQGKERDTRQNPLTGAGKAVEDFLQRTVNAGEEARRTIGGALDTLEDGLSSGLTKGRLDVSNFVDYIIKEFVRLQVVRPLLNGLVGTSEAPGGLINGLMKLFGFAKGGVFSGGLQLHAFANGGVVGGPTLFGMNSGLGVMGEAGPEAIMPLRRGSDGRLGVQGGGGTTVVNNYHVSAGVTRNELMTALQAMSQNLEARNINLLRSRGLI